MQLLQDVLRKHPISVFLVVTFAVTWGAWLPLAGRGVTVGLSPLYLLGLLGPLIGAFAASAAASPGEDEHLALRLSRIPMRLRWWGIAFGLPIAVACVTYVVVVGFAMLLFLPVQLPTRATMGMIAGFPATNAVALWLLLVVFAGLGQETGWRGFLLEHLQRRWSPLRASLGVAAAWAIWYVPALRLLDTPLAMIPAVLVTLVCASVFLTWLYDRSGHSIPLVAVWHATFVVVTGTVGARAVLAPVESAVVVVLAVAVILQELRVPRTDQALAR